MFSWDRHVTPNREVIIDCLPMSVYYKPKEYFKHFFYVSVHQLIAFFFSNEYKNSHLMISDHSGQCCGTLQQEGVCHRRNNRGIAFVEPY